MIPSCWHTDSQVVECLVTVSVGVLSQYVGGVLSRRVRIPVFVLGGGRGLLVQCNPGPVMSGWMCWRVSHGHDLELRTLDWTF
jgi:hypothetical protein